MDNSRDKVAHADKNKGKVETDESIHTEAKRTESQKQDDKQVREMNGTVNTEAMIVEDDVMRAGGLGARDDISSFLPVASDFTDFEANIREAREYEEPRVELCRHGLGWKQTTNETR